MNDYLKNIDLEKIKPLIITALCFAAIFVAGFGAGKLHSGNTVSASPNKRTLSNYTTNTNETTKNEPTNANVPATATTDPSNCIVKGSKSKMYHVRGGAFYDRTNADKCFATEAEAQAAGYTKSSR